MTMSKNIFTLGLVAGGIWLLSRRKPVPREWSVGQVRLDARRDDDRRVRTPQTLRVVKRSSEVLTVEVRLTNLSTMMRSAQMELYALSVNSPALRITPLYDFAPGRSLALIIQWPVTVIQGVEVGKDTPMVIHISHALRVEGKTVWGGLKPIVFVLRLV